MRKIVLNNTVFSDKGILNYLNTRAINNDESYKISNFLFNCRRYSGKHQGSFKEVEEEYKDKKFNIITAKRSLKGYSLTKYKI